MRGEVIPPFADTFAAITQATNGKVGGAGQIVLGILVSTSTSGTVTLSSATLGTFATAMPLAAGSWLPIPIKLPAGDQLNVVGGGTFAASVLLANP